jgi:methyl coenzyme M reductase subunit C-like uncharacterized protein (methanogenesis marker protein 7)
MQIVIDIDDYVYKKLMNKTICVADIVDAIKNGIPLPKGHGRLVDADVLKEKLEDHHNFFVEACGSFEGMTFKEKARVDEIINCIAEVVNAPTIIEADKECKC